MALMRKTLEDLRSNPPRLNAAERARLDAMTREEIECKALADRDNPPASEEELARRRSACCPPGASAHRSQSGQVRQTVSD
jgi:hypothetical protein